MRLACYAKELQSVNLPGRRNRILKNCKSDARNVLKFRHVIGMESDYMVLCMEIVYLGNITDPYALQNPST